MKRTLRTLVPLLLILAVLASTAWYFLIYDRELTKDLILWGARTLEADGKHDAAAKLYDLAYSHSGQEDAVAMELSQQYRDYGNYTKAEYTLTEAISDNPTAALYMALSKLYVEQDKLLDAVQMLDTVTDATIKAELESLRPAVPTVSYEPGFYSQYIGVEVLTDGGTLYVSRDGQYPSTADDHYTEAITLEIGQTTLHCLSVADNGLVSPLGLYGYTVGGVVEPVTFTDEAIEAAIRQLVNAGESNTIFTNDLWPLTEFTVPAQAKSYADLALLTRLESLTISEAPQGALAQMGILATLKSLSLPDSQLNEEDLAVLSAMTSLESLDLSGCGISSLNALKSLTNLKALNLNNNAVRNLSVLSGLTGLQELMLAHNAVTDLSSLSVLVNLTQLDVSHNSLTSLNPVCGISGLVSLKASHNQLSNIDTLKQLTKLQVLDLSFNMLTDVASLGACTAMEELNIANNSIIDVAAIGAMTKLTAFHLAHNLVEVLPAFQKDCPLVTIDASYNKLASVEQLDNIDTLNTVNVDYNEAIESLKPLDSCQVLIRVNAHGTKVSEVEFLTDKSIIVNYDPTN